MYSWLPEKNTQYCRVKLSGHFQPNILSAGDKNSREFQHYQNTNRCTGCLGKKSIDIDHSHVLLEVKLPYDPIAVGWLVSRSDGLS